MFQFQYLWQVQLSSKAVKCCFVYRRAVVMLCKLGWSNPNLRIRGITVFLCGKLTFLHGATTKISWQQPVSLFQFQYMWQVQLSSKAVKWCFVYWYAMLKKGWIKPNLRIRGITVFLCGLKSAYTLRHLSSKAI